jgi:hypothetical protein
MGENTSSFYYRYFLNLIATLLVFGLLLFRGVGATANAADAALPGDVLYPLKHSLECARASHTIDLNARAHTYLDLAGQRLADISILIEQGRYADLIQASQDFLEYVQKALLTTQEIAQTNPTQAAALSQQISAILSDYNAQLSQLLVSIPAETYPVIQGVLSTSEAFATQAPNATESPHNNAGDKKHPDHPSRDFERLPSTPIPAQIGPEYIQPNSSMNSVTKGIAPGYILSKYQTPSQIQEISSKHRKPDQVKWTSRSHQYTRDEGGKRVQDVLRQVKGIAKQPGPGSDFAKVFAA